MASDPVVSAYNAALLAARQAGVTIGTQAQRRLDRALLTVAKNMGVIAAAGGGGAKRADVLKRQALGMIEGLERALTTDVVAAQGLTVKTLVDIHKSVAVDLAKRYGTDAGLMAARFDDVQVRALGALAARGANAANFKSLMKYHLQDGVADIDRLIDAGVASGVAPDRLAKEIGDLLTKRAATNAASWAPTMNVAGLNTIRYDARRIAVTEINNALREANRQNLLAAGIVRAAKWQLSGAHAGLPSSPDRCDDMANTPGVDGQPGYYTIEAWPLAPHPHCGCTQGGPVLYRPSSQWNIQRKPAAPTTGGTPVITAPKAPPKPRAPRKPAAPKAPARPAVTDEFARPSLPKKPPPPATIEGYNAYVKAGGKESYYDWHPKALAARMKYERDVDTLSLYDRVAPDRARVLLNRKTFAPAANIDEARLQARFLMGADVIEPEKQTLVQASVKHGKAIPKRDRLAHLNRVNETLHELRQRYPTLRDDAINQFYLRDSGASALGRAHTRASLSASDEARYGGMSIKPRGQDAVLQARILREGRASGKLTSPRWSTSSEAIDPQAATTRHELMHRLTESRHEGLWRQAQAEHTKEILKAAAQGKGPASRKRWLQENVTDYSSTNLQEEIAEMGALFTEPGYKDGTLPVHFERILFDMLGATQEMIDARFPLPK